MKDEPLLEVDTVVLADAWSEAGDLVPKLEAAARAAAGTPTQPTDVALVLADDAKVMALNRDYRGKAKPTNVLSFPADPALGHLGDVVLAYETVRAEAAADEKSFADHACHLVVHGMLHLLGYDHETEAEAEAMEAREREILASLGIADPYRDSDPVPNNGAT